MIANAAIILQYTYTSSAQQREQSVQLLYIEKKKEFK